MSEARYKDNEIERMLENWRRYMQGDEYCNPLGVKISSFYRQVQGKAAYRTSSEPLILGDFRDMDRSINQLAPELQQAIRADQLERSATQRQKAWHCGLKSARAFVRRVDKAKRELRAMLNALRQRRHEDRMRVSNG